MASTFTVNKEKKTPAGDEKRGLAMSGSRTPESALDVGGDSFTSSREEDAADGIQHSHRMLSFSDALLSIIATVMILPVTHTEISPGQVLGNSLQHVA
uniref:Transmembrane protein 175 n=1 Tax=Equus asinus TaxID=9793 RepID=A0A9L0KGF8_EQUAS